MVYSTLMTERKTERVISSELHLHGIILGDAVRSSITRHFKRDRLLHISWSGNRNSDEIPVRIDVRRLGGPQSPVIFTFTAVGEDSTEYNGINLISHRRHVNGCEPQDIADFFIISKKALTDGVNPLTIRNVFLEVFHNSLGKTAADQKTQLAKELALRKYLP